MNSEKEKKTKISDLNIYQKMLLATEKISKVAKNLNVGTGKNQYKAVGESDVLNAVKPIEIELGIYSYPISRKVIDTQVLTITQEYDGKTTEKNQLFMRLEVIYRFLNVDNVEEYVDITTYGDGVDTQDKAPGKAMTYADKYALLKAYKIETGDDPDKDPSGELKAVKEIKATEPQIKFLSNYYKGETLEKLLEANKITKLEDLPIQKASALVGAIRKKGVQPNE